MPGLVVSMYRHAMIDDGTDVLDVGTGSGYGAALLARTGHRPLTTVVDATGPLPGRYDRIVSMTSVAPIPSSWLAALRPGGRLVTTLTGTGLIVTATKPPDGGAAGRTEWNGPDSCTPAPAPTTLRTCCVRCLVPSTAMRAMSRPAATR